MDNDRNVFISVPVGSEKWVLDMLWSARRCYSTCHCMPLIHFPPLSWANFCQSPFSACVQRCHKQWASVIQPPFRVCFHCAGLQVSAVGLHSHRQPTGWKIFGMQLNKPKESAHDTLCSTVKWHRGGSKSPCFPCMYFSVWMHADYSNTSSQFGPCRSRRSTFAASFSLHKGITVTRWTMWNLLPSPYDFPISGRNLPFGAGQSGIGEGKVLLWPEAQQRVSFDQWVSSGFGMGIGIGMGTFPACFITMAVSSHLDSSSL